MITGRVAGLTSTATVLVAAAVATINDLKLCPVHAAVGRVVALLVVLAGIGYVLQIDDTPAPQATTSTGAAAQPVDYSPRVGPVAGDRDFYATHRTVVPFGRSQLEIPILMYHYIRTPPSPYRDLLGYNLSVAPAVFTAQMDWLSVHGYHTVTFNDVRLYWRHVQPLPAKPVIITLDDGYEDLYTAAYPILAAHGFTAVAYIVSSFVGRKGYVTADQVKQLDSFGIEIAAHTVNHADLARTSGPWLAYQLVESKRWLETLLGHPVVDMAYPSGKFNPAAELAVASAGYFSATTEDYGIFHSQLDRFAWTRVRVGGGEPMSMFIINLGPAMPTVTLTSTAKLPQRLAMLMQA